MADSGESSSPLDVLFWCFVLGWQTVWFWQISPRAHPSPVYWWFSLLAALVSAFLSIRGARLGSLVFLVLGGLANLAFNPSTSVRLLIFWGYWAGLVRLSQDLSKPRYRWTRPLLIVYLFVLGTQLFLLVGELGMRILAVSDDTTRVPCLSYTNSQWKMSSLYDKEVNRSGYRDPDRVLFKPEGVRRVLFLGDSVTFGLGVPSASTFVREVERLLGPPYEALNLSVSGINLEREFKELSSRGLLYEPDAVVWVFFPNDIDGIGWDPGYSGIHPSLDNLYQNWLFYSYLQMRYNLLLGALGLRTSYAEGVRAAYQGQGYERFAEDMALLREWCLRNHKQLYIVLFPFIEDLEDYPLSAAHRRVAETAQQLGIPCLDLVATFAGHSTRKLQLNPHFDHHPNALANRLAAEAITEFLRPRLAAHFDGKAKR